VKKTARKERAWLSAVEVGEVPGLGGDVRVELTPRCTVLVGWNGAGKSLLIQAIESGLENATAHNGALGHFRCEVRRGDALRLSYELRLRAQRGKQVNGWTPVLDLFDERCTQHGVDGDRLLWDLGKGRLKVDRKTTRWPLPIGLLAAPEDDLSHEVNTAMSTLMDAFSSRSVAAGVPRRAGRRDPLALFTPAIPLPGARPSRLELLAHRLLGDSDSTSALETVRERGRRIGLLETIDVRRRDRPGPRSPEDPYTNIAEILVDGINLGLLSDGTLRVIEILFAMACAPAILLLEEPETEIHPGLLGRLLHEIESFAADSQVILATHSPQVVSWARPQELRLVERRGGRTSVRSLRKKETARLSAHLAHEGTLGEFVFGGALED
jgi:predicted ATPase